MILIIVNLSSFVELNKGIIIIIIIRYCLPRKTVKQIKKLWYSRECLEFIKKLSN